MLEYLAKGADLGLCDLLITRIHTKAPDQGEKKMGSMYYPLLKVRPNVP